MSDIAREAFEKTAACPEDLKDVKWTGSEYVAKPRSNSFTGAFQLMKDWDVWQKAWQAAKQSPDAKSEDTKNDL